LPGRDYANAREAQMACKGFEVGQLENIEVALRHGIGEQRGFIVQDHRGQVELAAFRHAELLIDGLR